MWTKTAKSPAFSNFLFSSVLLFLRSCFFFGLASGSLRARGFFFCLSLAKSNQRWPVQLAECFFFGLASGSLRARGFSFAFGSQKANSVGLYSSPGAFSSVLPLAPCGPGAFLLPFTRQRQAAPVFAVSPVPFEALYAGLFPYPNGKPALPYFPLRVRPAPHRPFKTRIQQKNAPYDQRPNGALWWALRNSNPYKFTSYRKISAFLCIFCVFCLKIRSV